MNLLKWPDLKMFPPLEREQRSAEITGLYPEMASRSFFCISRMLFQQHRTSLKMIAMKIQQHRTSLGGMALAWLGISYLWKSSLFATTVTPRPTSEDVGVPVDPNNFVLPEEIIARSKDKEPTVIRGRAPDSDHRGLVLDVLSIGSQTRPEYMTAQVETWASDVRVRHFWGVTELDDYDANCAEMSDDALHSFVETCLGTMGWEYNIETFRREQFGFASGYGRDERKAGWYCAQRRPGHALGWLKKMYQNVTMIPDYLLLVDDNTSVDIGKMVRQMQFAKHCPFVGADCILYKNIL